MPTELPYAADAEESLSFDELEVPPSSTLSGTALAAGLTALFTGPEATVPEGACAIACYCPDEVQLCVGSGEEPTG